LDEALDPLLAEALERRLAEAAAEALGAGETDDVAAQLEVIAVEDDDAALAEDPADLVGLPGLVVVVAEHADLRRAHALQRFRQQLRLVEVAVIGQVAAEQERVAFVLVDRVDQTSVIALLV